MATVFDAWAAMLATVLNIDVVSAGYILGIVFVTFLLVIISWAAGDRVAERAFLIMLGAPFFFVVLVGWWPPWTAVFGILLLLTALVNPFGEAIAA